MLSVMSIAVAKKPQKIRTCPTCGNQMKGCGCKFPRTMNGVLCCCQACVTKYEISHNLRKK